MCPWCFSPDTYWDLFNVGTGAISLTGNLITGNWAGALVDAGGIATDFGAAAVPGVPGGAAAAIQTTRAATNVVEAATKAASAAPAPKPSTLAPGPFARESIPATSTGKATASEQQRLNEIGRASGCHTCGTKAPGTKSGNFVGDHQPPSALAKPGQTQQLYPHCLSCSRQQGGEVRQATEAQRATTPPIPRPPKLDEY